MSWLDRGIFEQEADAEAGVAGSPEAAPAAAPADDTGATTEPLAAAETPAPTLAAGASPGTPLLYVATDLDSWETRTPAPNQDTLCERCGYRRLSPRYYAWLRLMMQQAQAAHARGGLAEADYAALRGRFNTMQQWAARHLGEEALRRAVRTFDPRGYRPPEPADAEAPREAAATPAAAPPETPEVPPPHLYPPDGTWSFSRPVDAGALAKVDAIREQALALGWTEAGLYQNRGRFRFPAGEDYGLVCFLRPADQVAEVTARAIELTNARGRRSRVYNRAIPQPWIRPAP